MTADYLSPQAPWSTYLAQIYTAGKRPVIGSYDHRVVEAKAREAMKDNLRTCLRAEHNARLIDDNITVVISCLPVYIWQCWDRQHV